MVAKVSNRNSSASEDPEKRQAILEVAIRTFARLGFRGADVQMIADGAGVGKGTVYRYFRSKEDLFWATTYEVLTRMERHIFAAIEKVEGALNKLRASAAAYIQFFEDNPNYLELTVQDRAEFHGCGPQSHVEHHKAMIQRMGNILQQGIDTGLLRPVDPELTTLALGCLLYGAALLGCHLRTVDVKQMTEQAIEIFLRGLRPDDPACLTCSPLKSKEGQEL